MIPTPVRGHNRVETMRYAENLPSPNIDPCRAYTSSATGLLAPPDRVAAIMNDRQELSILITAVQQLPDRCRQVFTLRKVYGYSQKEIAARLKIAENTVEQHLVTAVRHCADALDRCGLSPGPVHCPPGDSTAPRSLLVNPRS